MIKSQVIRDGKPHFVGDRGVVVRYRPGPQSQHAAVQASIAAAKARWSNYALRDLRPVYIPPSEACCPLDREYHGYFGFSRLGQTL